MKDYLIVGAGLAGLAFAEVALRNGKSVQMMDNGSQDASSVAAGLYNPVAIKRLKAIPDAGALLQRMNAFYERIPQTGRFFHRMPLLRKFHSVEEQNLWFEAADSLALSPFLSSESIKLDDSQIDAPFGFGEVFQTGYVDTRAFIAMYRQELSCRGIFVGESFLYDQLIFEADSCQYLGQAFRYVVFAEGFGLHQNPFFRHLPLNGTKGEILLIKSSELKLHNMINAGIFILPIGNDLYRVGATYGHQDRTNAITSAGRAELEEKLRKVLKCEYEVVGQEAGVRPTVRDRQPLLGKHHVHESLAVLNGLGTRGVLFAPTLAQALYQHLEFDEPLPAQYDIARFKR